jgi:uncharacterized membrane protein YdbT with pleckstrin-like domain
LVSGIIFLAFLPPLASEPNPAARVVALILLVLAIAVRNSWTFAIATAILLPVVLALGPTASKLVASAVCFILVSRLYVSVISTRYTIDRGRVQIQRGFWNRELENVEMWRITDIRLHRSLANLLTNDGTIVLTVEMGSVQHRRTVELKGLAKALELEQIFQKMVNLVWLLRVNQEVRGIYY